MSISMTDEQRKAVIVISKTITKDGVRNEQA